MAERGTFIGYDPQGEPVAVACYGPKADTRASARRFASTGNLKPREFCPGDPDLPRELDRWRACTLAQAQDEEPTP